jgi:L-threonylcarbamoyladenylate synthase
VDRLTSRDTGKAVGAAATEITGLFRGPCVTCETSMPSLEDAVQQLKSDQLVAIPTETVYGLAAAIDSEPGIKKIFASKKRPFFDPLIVHVSSKSMAKKLTTDWSPMADYLAEHFWPGPLTLILPKNPSINPLITSGLETVGIRMPRHSLALSLIDLLGMPVAAPSANRFGRTSPTTAQHVKSEFPDENFLILDGGPCDVGLESTVISIHRNHKDQYELSILRSGQVTQTEIEQSLTPKFQFRFVTTGDKKSSPGQMKHHYMPEIPLILVKDPTLTEAKIIEQTVARLTELPDEVESVQIRKPKHLNQISEMILPEEASLAARMLYSELRRLSETGLSQAIYFRIHHFHQLEEWKAAMDRLNKAASLVLNGSL